MHSENSGDDLTREELAWEIAEVFDELDVSQINEVLAKNVPLEKLEFFSTYEGEFAADLPYDEKARKRLPNLMLMGDVLRVLEERLLNPSEPFDA